MVDAEGILNEVLANIAKEQEFNNYEAKLTSYESEGANYTSQLFSIKLSAPGKDDLNLFAKVAAIGEKFRTVITLPVFETEIKFYTQVVPKYRELEERYDFPEDVRLMLAKYYGGSTEHMKEVLVLEELSVQGYQPYDRFKCFDWEYASQCASVLARLHALSVALLREEPDHFPDNQELAKFPIDGMKEFMSKAVDNALEVVSDKHKGILAKYFEENMTEKGFMSYYNPKRKIVLNHGDFRPNNVLHKRHENGKLQVAFVDFQIVQRSNPLVDLVYFFICGSDEEFRAKYRQQYFDQYFEEFRTTLTRLDIDPDEVYTREDYDADMDTLLPFGLVMAAMALPFITVDVADAPKPEYGIDIDSFAVETSNLYATRYNGLVNDYLKWGYLGSN